MTAVVVMSETKGGTSVGDDGNSDFTFGNDRALVWNNYNKDKKENKNKSIVNMVMNLDDKMLIKSSLLISFSRSVFDFYMPFTMLFYISEPITSIAYISIYVDI